MNIETLSKTRVGKTFIRLLAKAMESKFRYKFFPPNRVLGRTPNLAGQIVLEIGCGTGFFTIPIAKLVGDNGSLTSVDLLQESVDLTSKKVEAAKLNNVNVLKRNVLKTDFDSGTFDIVILFGVVPAPMVPLNQILAEIYRVLKPKGLLSIWPSIPGLRKSIQKHGSFSIINKNNSVLNFSKN
jgi:demethylmenaquinone methyltransferase/2-methoxy-6-polyprenyl-1,4-benzoquinol methylase